MDSDFVRCLSIYGIFYVFLLIIAGLLKAVLSQENLVGLKQKLKMVQNSGIRSISQVEPY